MTLRHLPPSWELPDVLTRIQQLESFRNDNITGQHVVSRVLLKRFARSPTASRGWELCSFDIRHPERPPKVKGLKGCAKVPNFIRFASRSSEELWQKVENRLHAALIAVDDETIEHRPEHLATIKDAIALHFVRSIQTATMHEWAWQIAEATSRQELLNQRELLEELFKEQVGLHAAGVEAIELIVDMLHASTRELKESGALLRGRIEYLYAKTREMIDASGLQFVKPMRGEFLIGDVPAVSVKKGQETVGILGGVALQEASTVVLPLGRHCLVNLGWTNNISRADEEAVQYLNGLQIRNVHRYIYFHPASGLENFARAALPSSS